MIKVTIDKIINDPKSYKAKYNKKDFKILINSEVHLWFRSRVFKKAQQF